MLHNMKKLLVILSSFGLIIVSSFSVVACSTPLNDLQKAFNVNNIVTLDNEEYTLAKLGLTLSSSPDMYNFYFNDLDSALALKIVQVKPNQAVSKLYFQGQYPDTAPKQNLEIAVLSGNNYSGQSALGEQNKVVSIPLTLSLMQSIVNPESSTGFSYQFTSLIMAIKINVTLT